MLGGWIPSLYVIWGDNVFIATCLFVCDMALHVGLTSVLKLIDCKLYNLNWEFTSSTRVEFLIGPPSRKNVTSERVGRPSNLLGRFCNSQPNPSLTSTSHTLSRVEDGLLPQSLHLQVQYLGSTLVWDWHVHHPTHVRVHPTWRRLVKDAHPLWGGQ